MALLCFLYFAGVALTLGAVAWLVEQSFPDAAQRRWVWCVTLLASITLPVMVSLHNSAPAIAIMGHTVLTLPARHTMGTSAAATMDMSWLDCDRATYGKFLLRMSVVWSGVLLVWGLANTLWVSRVVRRSSAGAGDTGRRIVDGVPVVVTDTLGPATVGLVRARVLIPRWVLTLSRAQRQYVVRHEEEHRRARDPLVLCLASVLVALLAWNLPLWWQLRRLRLAIETDCDRRVVRALGNAPAYGDLLLTVAQASSRGPLPQPALLGRAGMLERRLTRLVAPDRGMAFRLLAFSVACAVLVAVLSIPHPMPMR